MIVAWATKPILIASGSAAEISFTARRDAIIGRFILTDTLLFLRIDIALERALLYCDRDDGEHYGAPAEAIRRINFSTSVRAGMPINAVAFNPLASPMWGRLVIEVETVDS